MSLDELLNAATQLSEPELDTLVNQVLLLRARRKTVLLPTAETGLLLQINQGIPLDVQQRYNSLADRRDAELLTDTEYEELLALSDQIEHLTTQRTAALVKLAELRQVPLLELMDTLGIKAASYA
jgi:hypothetical protein